MMARELRAGKRFRVVGLPDWWEVLKIRETSVLVRPIATEMRRFSTLEGDEVTITFRPKAFSISRETSVEVDE